MHTFMRLCVPFSTTRTRWMFGLHRRLVFFFDQGTLGTGQAYMVERPEPKSDVMGNSGSDRTMSIMHD